MRLFKKCSACLGAVLTALLLTVAVSAEYAADTNLLAVYDTIWNGDALLLENDSKAVYFSATDGKTDYTASYTFKLPETLPHSYWFYVDIGNGKETSDIASAELLFTDKSGTVIKQIFSGDVIGGEKYRRFYSAAGDEYYPLPENAKSVTIMLNARDTDADGKIRAYFRNFSLIFSDTQTISGIKAADIPTLMTVSDELSYVEQNGTMNRIVWILIVVVIAFVFYFIRLKQQKYKTTKVMKPVTKRKILK